MLNAFQYAEAMARVKRMPEGAARFREWRRVKSARQLYLNRKRRETAAGQAAWRERLAAAAEYRRTRAADDCIYRERRNAQSHVGRAR